MSGGDRRERAMYVLRSVLGSPLPATLIGGFAGDLAGRVIAGGYNFLMPGEGFDVNPEYARGLGLGLGALGGGTLLQLALANRR